ncbi:TolC family protein [Nannocystis pusilla]|uniref:TolC family protein n=1 Tax=Nannocystis pusilla TaxID=889268 RepID=UPI003B7903FF
MLPAPLGRTYKGEIAESKALARRAEAEVERWRRVVQAEVEVALREVEARKAELGLFEAERLQRAEGHLEALAQEMATGRVSIRDAVVLQQTLLEYLAAHIEARRALALGSVELARVAGLLPEGAQR